MSSTVTQSRAGLLVRPRGRGRSGRKVKRREQVTAEREKDGNVNPGGNERLDNDRQRRKTATLVRFQRAVKKPLPL